MLLRLDKQRYVKARSHQIKIATDWLQTNFRPEGLFIRVAQNQIFLHTAVIVVRKQIILR